MHDTWYMITAQNKQISKTVLSIPDIYKKKAKCPKRWAQNKKGHHPNRLIPYRSPPRKDLLQLPMFTTRLNQLAILKKIDPVKKKRENRTP